MKATYSKPVFQAYGSVTDLTRATGASPNTDFIFFNGNPIGNPSDPDDGKYSYFCGPSGCNTGVTPAP